VHAAAAASPPLVDNEPRPADIREWVARLPVAMKDDFLVRFIADNDGLLASELLRQVRRKGAAEQGTPSAASESRTVSELLQAAERAADEQRRVAAENAARENARREREAAIARARHLDALAGREPAVWKQVESLIATRQPKRYDEAVMLLVDLRDIAARKVATTSGGASRSCALYTRASRRRLRACAKVGGVTPLAALCRHQRR